MENLAIGQYGLENYFPYAYKTKYTLVPSDSTLGSIVVGVLEPVGNNTGSGILLSEDIVLSAAHVVNSGKLADKDGIHTYSFGIGYVPGTVVAADAVATQASSIISLRNYTGSFQTNDVVAIRLDAPVSVDKSELLGITSCYGPSKKLTEALKSMFSVGFPGLYTVADDQLTSSGKVDSYALSSGASIVAQPSELESLDVSSARYDGQMNWSASGIMGAAGHSGGPAIVNIGGKQFIAGNFTWANATGPNNGANNNGAGVGGILLSDKDYAVLSAAIAKTNGTLPRVKLAWSDDSTNLILGSDDAGGDTIDTVWRSELVFAGDGNDVIIGSSGNDSIDGGADTDTVDYRGMSVKLVGGTANDGTGLHIAKGADGLYGTDTLHDVEEVVIGKQTLKLDAVAEYDQGAKSEKIAISFEAGAAVDQDVAAATSNDATAWATLDLSAFGADGGVILKNGRLAGTNWTFRGANEVIGSSKSDTFNGLAGVATVDGGGGKDEFRNIGSGTQVTTGSGADEVYLSNNILITDASAEDNLYAYDDLNLTGGVSWKGSEDVWAHGAGGMCKYGYNAKGELVVGDLLGNLTYVANGQSTNYGSDPAGRAFGLYVAEMDVQTKLFRELETPWNVDASYAAILSTKPKAELGISLYRGADPLVLDLDGDGIDLVGQSSVSPRFDLDGDGFSEKTGWVGSGDGLLALDRNGNGVIDDVSELFGGPRADGGVDTNGDGRITGAERMQSGFDALAAYDGNGDGVIDASDAVFSELRVWIVADGDAVTDEGELKTLAEVGITSISLASTDESGVFVAGNQVTATGGFTRTDGSTSTIANVDLKIDNFDSQWLAATTLSETAAALPELRGHGTLADLRQVMTLTPSLETVVVGALDDLGAARGMEAIRSAAIPVLLGWAASLPAVASTEHYQTVHVVLGASDRHVVDYAYAVQVDGTERWMLASSNTSYESLAALKAANPSLDGRWRDLSSDELAFVERYTGEQLPTVLDAGSSKSAVVAAFDMAYTHLDMLSVRLAVQAAPDYYGLSYDVSEDLFRPATDRQLVPFFEHVFSEVQTATPAEISAYFATMNDVFDRIVTAYDRGTGNSINSFGFLYANLVAAWENVGLPISLNAAASDFGIPETLLVDDFDAPVEGTGEANIFYLGSGDQTVYGKGGHDDYVIGRNFGHDTIVDDETNITHDDDYVRFAQYASTEITATRDGLDLLLTVVATGDEVRIVNQFAGFIPGIMGGGETSSAFGIDLIQFVDGVQWTREDIAWQVSRSSSASETILGTPDKDVLDGGAGDDILVGGNDFDIYLFGYGYGHDVVDERVSSIGSAAFAVVGWDQDAVQFGEGITEDDLTFAREGGDLILGLLGSDDTLTVKGQFNSTYTGVFGQIWMDRIEIFRFADGSSLDWTEVMDRTIAAQETQGDDTVMGFDVADVLDGGAGDDFLSGGNDGDTYVFGLGYGHDLVRDAETSVYGDQADSIAFGYGLTSADVMFSHPEDTDDLVVTLADGSTLTIQNQFGIIYTGVVGDLAFDRIERFVFTDADGETVLSARDVELRLIAEAETSGDDRIFGFASDDRLDGGAGGDLMKGGDGNDTYVFGHGYGHDRIAESSSHILAPETDVVALTEDVSPDQVRVTRGAGNDIVLTLTDTGETLTLSDQTSYGVLNWRPSEVESVAFADGTIWTAADLRSKALENAATSGDDTVEGFFSDDVIDGGAGDDLLMGGDGSDTYVFGRGSGHDTIDERLGYVTYSSVDRVVFGSDVAPSDIVVTRPGNDDEILLTIADTGDSLLLLSQDWQYSTVESYVFADGTTWSLADLKAKLIAQTETAGNDVVTGFGGADRLEGGKGDDVLDGREGDDTYVYARGDGHDTIDEGTLYAGTADRLVLTGIDPGDVSLRRSGDDLILDIAESSAGTGDGGSILLKYVLVKAYDRGVEFVEFANGTVWTANDLRNMLISAAGTDGDDTIAGSNVADVIAGGKGNDALNGGAGDDTYVYARGDGNDTVSDGYWGGTSDRLLFTDIGPGDVTLQRSGNDVTFSIAESAAGAGDGGSVRLTSSLDDSHYDDGIEQVVFGDGTVWSRAEIRAMLLAQASTAGADTIAGFNAPDTITAGRGDDVINGAGGDDTYVYARGDGNDTISDGYWGGTSDRLLFADIGPGDVTLQRSGNDVTFWIAESEAGAGDGGSVRLTSSLDDSHYDDGIERVVFGDGTVWSRAEIRAMLLAQASTAGADTIVGFNAPDTITAGRGDDVINGAGGDDTYVYARGDGNDTITEDTWGGPSDRIVFSDLAPTEVTLERTGNDLVIRIAESASGAGDGGSILIRNTLDDSMEKGVEALVFADGTTWSRAEVRMKLLAQASTDGNDTIVGFNVADTITAGKGDDVINGGIGNDTYVWARGDGDDTITEDKGNGTGDRIVFSGVASADVRLERHGNDLTIVIAESSAGAGDGGSILVKNTLMDNGGQGVEAFVFADGISWSRTDVLARAVNFVPITTGNDVYAWAHGDASEVIGGGGVGGVDQLTISGVDIALLDFARSGANGVDLVVTDTVSGKTITVRDQFSGSGAGIEILVVGDTTLDATAIAERAWYRGGAGDDSFAGSDLNERFDGGAGDDVISAGAGNDVLHGGAGSDALAGEVGSDDYYWAPGDGSDVVSDWWNEGDVDVLHLDGVDLARLDLARGGNNNADLLVTDTLTGETITVYGQFYGSGSGIESLVIGATTLDTTAIAEQAWYRGGSGDDGFWGGDLSERFDGGAGGDLLFGGAGDDVFHGGTGADTLAGEVGSDDYFWAPGDGSDVISDLWNEGDVDVLHLDGVDLDRLDLARGGGDNADLLVTDTLTGETITVTGQLYGSGSGIESLVVGDTTLDATAIAERAWYRGGAGDDSFAGSDLNERFDGGAGDDVISAGAGNDVLHGGAGSDALAGEVGSDDYYWAPGDGSDVVSDWWNEGDVDVLHLDGVDLARLDLARGGNNNADLLVTDTLTGETITVYGQFYGSGSGIESLVIGATTLDTTAIAEQAWYRGGSGDDGFWGGDLSERFDGGAGADLLVGGAGDDVYRYASGDGNDTIDDTDGLADRLVFSDLTAADVRLLIVGDDLHVDVLGTGATLTDAGHFASATRGLDQITFSDGTTWSRSDITSHAVAA